MEALAFALFLPVVDHLSGLVEDLNPLVVSDPALALQLGLQAFPGILTGPEEVGGEGACLLYTSPSPRDQRGSRMPSSA